MSLWRGWREATAAALYGPDGFFRRPEGPAGHFRTSVHVGAEFATAVAALAYECELTTVIDVGAGRGELSDALASVAPDLTVLGVEIDDTVPADTEALVVANEWLDNVPADVVTLTPDGPRLVEVNPGGDERSTARVASDDLAWLERWWPLTEPGARAEVGSPRDAAWASVVGATRRGVVVAIDYGHVRADRPLHGTLTGYRDGHQVVPVPDGSCDITAHVALDACAAAGVAAGATATVTLDQRKALRALGLDGRLPPIDRASTDPASYLHAVGSASRTAELLDPSGLGAHTWLVQAVGMDLPRSLAAPGPSVPRTMHDRA